MRYAIAGVWLVLAFLSVNVTVPRRFFAYAGSILALVHICAVALGVIDRQMNRRPAEGGVPVGGFYTGIVLGLIMGIVAGGYVSRNTVLYWLAQIVTAAFLVFLPLFPL